jgi:hypothetical protein
VGPSGSTALCMATMARQLDVVGSKTSTGSARSTADTSASAVGGLGRRSAALQLVWDPSCSLTHGQLELLQCCRCPLASNLPSAA